MASVMKAIKPSYMKVDALRLKLLTTMHKVEREMKKDFQATTETWEHKPVFVSMVTTIDPSGASVMVWTDDEIYGYVNNGTGEHIIVPKEPGNTLVFNWDGYGSYGPKTTPDVIGSVDAVIPEAVVGFTGVVHPGNEARNFDKAISEKWLPIFVDYCEQAVRETITESGHSMEK